VTWKVPESGYDFESATKLDEKDISRIPMVRSLADSALIGILKVIENINSNPKILSYRNKPHLEKFHENNTGDTSAVPFKVLFEDTLLLSQKYICFHLFSNFI
jgi:hypothetical protein